MGDSATDTNAADAMAGLSRRISALESERDAGLSGVSRLTWGISLASSIVVSLLFFGVRWAVDRIRRFKKEHNP